MDETRTTTPSNTASTTENSKTTDKSLPKSSSTHRHSLSNGSHTHKRTLSFVPENEKLSNETSDSNDGHHRVSSLQNNVEDVWSRRPSIGDNFAHQSDDDDDADWGISDDTNFKPVPRTPHTAGRCFCSKCKTSFGSTLSPSASSLSLSGLANNTNPNASHHSVLHRSHSRESTSSAALSIAASDRDLYATAMSGAGSVAQTPPHRTPASTPHHHHHQHQHHHHHQYHSPHTPHTPHTTPTPSNLAHDFMERWKQRAAANNNACTAHHQHGHSCVHHRLQLSQTSQPTQSSSSHAHTNTAHTHHLSTVSNTSTVSASSHSNMYPPASHSHGTHAHHAHTQSQPPLIHAHSLPSQPPPFSSSVSTSSSTGSGVVHAQYPYPGPHLLRLHSEESVASTHSLGGFYDGSTVAAVPATSLSTVPTSPTSTSLQPARGLTTNVTLVASSSPRRSLTTSAPTAESLGSLGLPLSSPCCHHHNHHSRGSFCGSDDSTTVADKSKSAAGGGTDNHHVVIIDTVNSSYDSSLLPGGAINYETCSCSCACASAGDRTPRKLGDESTDTGTGTGTATEEEEDEDWDQEIEMEQSVTPKIITPRGSIMDPEKHARTLLTDLDADTVGLNKRYLQRIALPLLRMETHKFFAELHTRYKKICEEFRLFPVKYYQVLIDGLRRNRELASVDAMKRDFDAYIQKMDGQMQKIKDDISGGIAPLDSVASKARYAQLCEFRDLLEEFSVGFNVNTAATRTMDALPTTSSNAEGNRVLISLLRAFDILIDSEAGSKIDVARLSLSYQRLANTFLENHHIQEQKWKRDE